MYLESVQDFQTLAILSCLFSMQPAPSSAKLSSSWKSGTLSITTFEFDNTDPSTSEKWSLVPFRKYCLVYASMLYQWGLLEKRAEILKYLALKQPSEVTMDLVPLCEKCGKDLVYAPSLWCASCERFRAGVRCVFCRLSVRGLASFCILCGHGGHTEHMQMWLETTDQCSSGCGCHCILDTDTGGE